MCSIHIKIHVLITPFITWFSCQYLWKPKCLILLKQFFNHKLKKNILDWSQICPNIWSNPNPFTWMQTFKLTVITTQVFRLQFWKKDLKTCSKAVAWSPRIPVVVTVNAPDRVTSGDTTMCDLSPCSCDLRNGAFISVASLITVSPGTEKNLGVPFHPSLSRPHLSLFWGANPKSQQAMNNDAGYVSVGVSSEKGKVKSKL